MIYKTKIAFLFIENPKIKNYLKILSWIRLCLTLNRIYKIFIFFNFINQILNKYIFDVKNSKKIGLKFFL